MTYAQFKRLKPKYKIRIYFVIIVGLLLFTGLLKLVSCGISVVNVQLNTTRLKDFTSENILLKNGMLKIQEVMKQNDAGNIVVMDSKMDLVWQGEATGEDGRKLPRARVSSVTVNMVNLVDSSTSENWTLTAEGKKVVLQRTSVKKENMNTLKVRKIAFQIYYPALSRVTSENMLNYLEQEFPVGVGGVYHLVNSFDQNVQPQFQNYVSTKDGGKGLRGLWVSETGAVSDFSDFGETYTPPGSCAPHILSLQAVNEEKSTEKKTVLLSEQEKAVVLLKAATY
ncbi:MAG: hypothetical protein HFG20_02140 [Anaerotruncus sp.]|nr:hypothetical protein [Anaerotruncus sp.]